MACAAYIPWLPAHLAAVTYTPNSCFYWWEGEEGKENFKVNHGSHTPSHLYTCMRTLTHMPACTAHTHTKCASTHTHTHTYTHTHTQTYAHKCSHSPTQTYTRTHMYNAQTIMLKVMPYTCFDFALLFLQFYSFLWWCFPSCPKLAWHWKIWKIT